MIMYIFYVYIVLHKWEVVMEAKVLEVRPNGTPSTFDVLVSMDADQHVFTIEVETDRIGEHEIQVAKSQDKLWEAFNHNPVATNIYKLVLSVYNNEPVNLPVNLHNL